MMYVQGRMMGHCLTQGRYTVVLTSVLLNATYQVRYHVLYSEGTVPDVIHPRGLPTLGEEISLRPAKQTEGDVETEA